MIELFIKSLVAGFSVLIVALILNFIASKLGITTWYDFVKDPLKASLMSYLWLFFIYPLLLGLSAYFALSFFK